MVSFPFPRRNSILQATSLSLNKLDQAVCVRSRALSVSKITVYLGHHFDQKHGHRELMSLSLPLPLPLLFIRSIHRTWKRSGVILKNTYPRPMLLFLIPVVYMADCPEKVCYILVWRASPRTKQRQLHGFGIYYKNLHVGATLSIASQKTRREVGMSLPRNLKFRT